MMEQSLPADIKAEYSTAGSILLDRDAIILVAPWLFPEYFYTEKIRTVYEAQLACYNRRVPPDLVNVADELRRQGTLDRIGGAAFLIELSNSVPTSVHVEYYAQIVERTALHRRLISAGGEIARIGYNEDSADIDETFARAEEALAAARKQRGASVFKTAADAANDLFKRTSDEGQAAAAPAIKKTGFPDLDKKLCGLYPGDVTVIGAPSGCGKTALMLSMADYIARKDATNHIAILSLEMGSDQLVARMAAMRCGVGIQDALDGKIPGHLFDAYTEAIGEISALPITFIEESEQSITQARMNLRYLNTINPVRLVMIDYLQLLSGAGHNREQEVASVSRGVKAMAREMHVPTIALTQLNDEGKVRESRGIFNDASQVLILHREELINPDTDLKGLAEINVTKNRNGPTGKIALRYIGAETKFVSLDTRYQEQEGYR